MQSFRTLCLGLGFVILPLLIQLACFRQDADRFLFAPLLDIGEQFIWVVLEYAPAAARFLGALSHLFRFVQVVADVQVATDLEEFMRIGGQLDDFAWLAGLTGIVTRNACFLQAILWRLGSILVHVLSGLYRPHNALPLHLLQDVFRAVAPRPGDGP